MLQSETVLLLLPTVPVALVLNRILPPAVPNAAVDEPSTVHLVTVFPVASLINRTVLVPPVVETVVLEIVSEFPAVFRPSIVTLSAPLRSINGFAAVVAPVTVRAPTGVMVSEAHVLTAG